MNQKCVCCPLSRPLSYMTKYVPCNHSICRDCLNASGINSNQCPLCAFSNIKSTNVKIRNQIPVGPSPGPGPILSSSINGTAPILKDGVSIVNWFEEVKDQLNFLDYAYLSVEKKEQEIKAGLNKEYYEIEAHCEIAINEIQKFKQSCFNQLSKILEKNREYRLKFQNDLHAMFKDRKEKLSSFTAFFYSGSQVTAEIQNSMASFGYDKFEFKFASMKLECTREQIPNRVLEIFGKHEEVLIGTDNVLSNDESYAKFKAENPEIVEKNFRMVHPGQEAPVSNYSYPLIGRRN